METLAALLRRGYDITEFVSEVVSLARVFLEKLMGMGQECSAKDMFSAGFSLASSVSHILGLIQRIVVTLPRQPWQLLPLVVQICNELATSEVFEEDKCGSRVMSRLNRLRV